jgi:septin family protein
MTTTKKITLAKIGKLVPIRLNMMVVGETGSGKTTFLRTLFKNYCEDEVVRAELTALTVKTVEIMEIGEFQIKSDAVACQVHLLDSPGFGDYIDNNCAINTVKEYLTKAHNSWLSSNSNLVPDEVSFAMH